MRFPLLLTAMIAIPALLLTACAGGGRTGSGDSGAAWSEPPDVRTSNPGEGAVGRNRRIVMHIPASSQSVSAIDMVLVDEGHAGRRTPEGRQRLALGQSQLGYKVLAESEMDALLESLSNHGLQRIAEPFERGDERYFDSATLGAPGYRGLLFLDVDGRLTKAVAWKPNGADDKAGQERYRIFRDLKYLVLAWYRSHNESEMPRSGIALPTSGGQ